MTGDVYGGWRPTTPGDLALCEADPYITPAGVVPAWVLELRDAVASPEVCTCGHFPVRRHCGSCSTSPTNSAGRPAGAASRQLNTN